MVFVLVSSVRVPLAQLPMSYGLLAGLARVAKTLATELGPAGSGSRVCCPAGSPGTEFVSSMLAAAIPTRCALARLSTSRLSRYDEPEEFARVAAILLSRAAAYVTGAMIPVDRGAIPSI